MIPSDKAKQLILEHGLDMAIDIAEKSIKESMNNRQNHWLHSDTWPDLVKAGLVQELPQQMIGYDKI